MLTGWLVRVEVEAGRGEIEPFAFVVAESDFQRAKDLATKAPELKRPRAVLGDKPPLLIGADLVHPVDDRTISKLGLAPGELWNLNDPPQTDRIQFAVKS